MGLGKGRRRGAGDVGLCDLQEVGKQFILKVGDVLMVLDDLGDGFTTKGSIHISTVPF